MSEQTSVAPCCVSGHIHEGVPTGNFETVHGLRTYVSNPKEASSGKQDTVIFLSDIFGVDLVNTKLVADEWAGQGYKVLLPDLFDNDPVPHQHLKAIVPNVRDKEKSGLKEKAETAAVMATSLGPWLVKHREAVSKPIIEKFVQDVKSDANTGKIITVGFCWGGRYSLLLANDDSPVKTDVAIAFHPSFLVEADLKNINSIPVGIFAGEEDDMMSIDQLNKFEQDLKPRLNDKLVVEKYPGAVHGFAVRGDDMVASEKKTKEDSHQHAFKFVKRWVQ